MEKQFDLDDERKYSLAEVPSKRRISSPEGVNSLMRFCSDIKDWSNLLNNRKILEVGAGECSFLPMFLKVSKPKRYVATDLFPERMEMARQYIKSPLVEFCEANILSLPFNNSEFDLILAFGILHHIPSINKALAEIVRVMKVNGLFIFRDPCSENPMVWLKYKFCHKSANEFPISRKDIKVAFRATGMSIVYLNRFWLRFPWLPAGLWSVNLGGVARKI